MESLVRRKNAMALFGVQHTFFDEKIAPRLDRVQIGGKAVIFTMSSIQRVIGEMIEETGNAPKRVPPPNTIKPAAKAGIHHREPRKKRRRAA